MIERIAQRLWNAESVRAAGRDRLIPWSEVEGPEQEKWRYMAQAVLTELSAGDGVQEMDREAVAELYQNVGKPGMTEELVSGNMDDHPTLEAFARHRTLAAAAERARIVARIRERAALVEDLNQHADLHLLADAIEAGKV